MNARSSFPSAGPSGQMPAAHASAALATEPCLPLLITCLGEAQYRDGDPGSCVYTAARTVTLATADSIAGAIAAVGFLVRQDQIDIRDDSAVSFTPRLFVVLDDDQCQVLAGEPHARGIDWCEPVASDGEARRVVSQACDLRREASRETAAQHHAAARSLRFRASVLEGRLVHPDWRERARAALQRVA